MSDQFEEVLATLAEGLVVESSTDEVLEEVVELVGGALARCSMSGITLLKGGEPATAARSHPEAQRLDDAQYLHEDGPCLASLDLGHVVAIEDLRQESRWPEFTAEARRQGIVSTLSMPLVVRGESIGALNCYSREAGPYDRATLGFAEVCAKRISVTIANAKAYEDAVKMGLDLQQALRTRDTIGQAKGLLMASSTVTSDEAFDMLRRASQRSNQKLHDVAAEMVEAANARARAKGALSGRV